MPDLNAIPDAQNQPEQLKKLGAVSQLYLEAKRLLGINMLLSVPIALVWAGLVAFVPALKIYAAAWGLALTLLGIFFFIPTQKQLQTQAAQVQQLFDCQLFELNWQDFYNLGRPPDPELIYAADRKYRRKNPTYEGLKDWYPPVIGQLPLPLARLVCQRTNCWWDAELRRTYAGWVITLLSLLAVLVLLIGFVGGLTLEKFFLAVIAPLAPALVLGIRQYRDHMAAAAYLDQLKGRADDIWDSALETASPDMLYQQSIKLQDAIFKNRSTSPLIFNWFYKRLRSEKQDSMNVAADALVAQAQQTLGPFR